MGAYISNRGIGFANRVATKGRVLTLRRSFILVIILFATCSFAAAQGGSITGNIFLPSGAYLNERARITLQTERGIRSSVYTDDRGRFEFKGLTPAIYEVVIEADRDRFEIARAKIEVFPGSPAIININLKDKKAADARPAARVISAGELDSAIPGPAKKEFEHASDASRSGRIDDAIAHLRKAIAIYPQYLMAHNDLGTQLLSQGKLDEATEEFRRAIQIDSKAFNPRLNLGIVLVQKKQFSEALETLKIALAGQPDSPAAILYNGLALEGTNNLEGAERDFKAAHDLGGVAYALALFHLGQIYSNQGDRKRAREMFEEYLREAPDGADATRARKMIAILK